MLVLSRRVGESIVIDRDVRVTVVSIKGDKVRLGVSAPPNVLVDREEIRQRRIDFPDGPTGNVDAVAAAEKV